MIKDQLFAGAGGASRQISGNKTFFPAAGG